MTSECHASEAGLTSEEYNRVVRLLHRKPNKVELGIIGAMWSEHCSYKSTKAHLSNLPSKAPHVLVGPGENAGVVDIGDDLALVFKIESHNHPSYLEPFSGAATGVGGILRDIFTMGARPFATANLLRFGKPSHPKVPHLLNGVVGGISYYGNCFGVPTVLSNVDFHHSYNGNNLVNAFAIGVVNKHDIFLGSAAGEKNRVLYVGAKTGRDGIMGAVMASDCFDDNSQAKRPTVQVGDAFVGKLLLEACLEVFSKRLLVGIQDMGAAGLTCSTFEMANRASTGLIINLDLVPLRDETMTAYEIMLSESQERMLMIAKPNQVEPIKDIFRRFELDCADIGVVTGDGLVRINHKGHEIVNLSSTLIIENAPRYRRAYLNTLTDHEIHHKQNVKIDVAGAIENCKSDIGQKELSFITNQFDYHIGLNTIVGPNESDAALIKVPNSQKAVAIALLANGKLCKINPFEGARRQTFQALLEISAQGAKPLGITNCLNFGSVDHVSVMTDLKHAIDGMADAANSFTIPIVSGNVSLYNETNGQPILPTLALCLVGLSEKPRHHTKFAHAKPQDNLVMLGDLPEDYAGCESILPSDPSPSSLVPWEVEAVRRICDVLTCGIHAGFITCTSVVGRGGLINSLIQIMVNAKSGADISFGCEWLSDELALGLLSENSPRVLVSINDENYNWLAQACADKILLHRLGRLGGEFFTITHETSLVYKESIDTIAHSYLNGLGEWLAKL